MIIFLNVRSPKKCKLSSIIFSYSYQTSKHVSHITQFLSIGYNKDFHKLLMDVKIIKSFYNQLENMYQVYQQPKIIMLGFAIPLTEKKIKEIWM